MMTISYGCSKQNKNDKTIIVQYFMLIVLYYNRPLADRSHFCGALFVES